mmetsp:Transcript_55153/g.117668  ORF Transcript_55153/g.117668 Transcript_55153/m.117668 type:complete len:120 (+) Transcript_55153:162-521(+)
MRQSFPNPHLRALARGKSFCSHRLEQFVPFNPRVLTLMSKPCSLFEMPTPTPACPLACSNCLSLSFFSLTKPLLPPPLHEVVGSWVGVGCHVRLRPLTHRDSQQQRNNNNNNINNPSCK